MVILGFLAILFAIPTYGLSLLALLLIAGARGYLRGIAFKTKERYDNAFIDARNSMSNGIFLKPTWINNKSAQVTFESAVHKAASEEGLSNTQINNLFCNKEIASSILTVAASFQKYKFSKLEQIVGATDLAKKVAKDEFTRIKNGTPSLVDGYSESHTLCESGQRLFAQGKYTQAFNAFSESIEKYDSSIAYYMRAIIYAHRLRHYEALQDLLMAKSTNDTSNHKIKANLDSNIAICEILCHAYESNLRNEIIREVKDLDTTVLPHKLLTSWIGIDARSWSNGDFDYKLLEHYYYNELYSIITFEEFENYQDATIIADMYPSNFLKEKAESSLSEKHFKPIKIKSESLLCTLDIHDMYEIRTATIEAAHERLMLRDYGNSWNSSEFDAKEITIEAEDYNKRILNETTN